MRNKKGGQIKEEQTQRRIMIILIFINTYKLSNKLISTSFVFPQVFTMQLYMGVMDSFTISYL